MLFHLITIQNSNSDDIVFHGFDYDALRLQVAAYCREDWHHGMASSESLPEDREEQIEAYFQDHDRMFLIEQELTLDLPQPFASASELLQGCQLMLEAYAPHRDESQMDRLHSAVKYAVIVVRQATA